MGILQPEMKFCKSHLSDQFSYIDSSKNYNATICSARQKTEPIFDFHRKRKNNLSSTDACGENSCNGD